MSRFFRTQQPGFLSYKQPDTFYKGEKFEEFVEEVLFPESDFDLVQRTSSAKENSRRFSEHSLDPDFLFRDRESGMEFFIECKFRNPPHLIADLEWSYPAQLKRYVQVDQSIPVFVCIGLFGHPNNPCHLFLVPLSKAPYPVFFESVLERYELKYVPIKSKHLHKLLQ